MSSYTGQRADVAGCLQSWLRFGPTLGLGKCLSSYLRVSTSRNDVGKSQLSSAFETKRIAIFIILYLLLLCRIYILLLQNKGIQYSYNIFQNRRFRRALLVRAYNLNGKACEIKGSNSDDELTGKEKL